MNENLNIHKMVRNLGDKVMDAIPGPITVVGIQTGGTELAQDLMNYLLSKGRDCRIFNIKVDKIKGYIVEGKEHIENNDTTYVCIDDAIWTNATREIVAREFEQLGVPYKYAVLLDPRQKADFSVYN